MNASNLTQSTTIICFEEMPLSGHFFMSMSTAEKALAGICAVVSLLTVIDFAEQVNYILHRYQTNMAVRYKSIQLVGICSVVSLTSLVALFIPRANIVSQLASSVYISRCMFEFITLMVLYFGGPEKILCRLKDVRMSMAEPPCCCCCLCLPTLAVTAKHIQALKILVLQNAILQPLLTFITIVLWIDAKYTDGQFSLSDGYPYLNVVSVVSSILALYGFMVFFKLCRNHLKSADIVPKCVALQLVIVLCQLQDTLFSILAKFGIPPCEGTLSSHVRGQAYLQMVLVLQMFLLALLSRCFYRRPHDILSNLSADPDVTTSACHVDTDKLSSPANTNSLSVVKSQPLENQK